MKDSRVNSFKSKISAAFSPVSFGCFANPVEKEGWHLNQLSYSSAGIKALPKISQWHNLLRNGATVPLRWRRDCQWQNQELQPRSPVTPSRLLSAELPTSDKRARLTLQFQSDLFSSAKRCHSAQVPLLLLALITVTFRHGSWENAAPSATVALGASQRWQTEVIWQDRETTSCSSLFLFFHFLLLLLCLLHLPVRRAHKRF